MNSKKITGVTKITGYINNKVIPYAPTPFRVSEDIVRRELKKYEDCGSGGLVCEKRPNKKASFEIYQTSLDALYATQC